MLIRTDFSAKISPVRHSSAQALLTVHKLCTQSSLYSQTTDCARTQSSEVECEVDLQNCYELPWQHIENGTSQEGVT